MINRIINTPEAARIIRVEAKEARTLGYYMLSAAFHNPVDGSREGDAQLDEAFRLRTLSIQLEFRQLNNASSNNK